MDMSCPYCHSSLGYYQIQQVKRQKMFSWNGRFVQHRATKVFYEGKIKRCLECDQKVTSFAIGAQRELDNA